MGLAEKKTRKKEKQRSERKRALEKKENYTKITEKREIICERSFAQSSENGV